MIVKEYKVQKLNIERLNCTSHRYKRGGFTVSSLENFTKQQNRITVRRVIGVFIFYCIIVSRCHLSYVYAKDDYNNNMNALFVQRITIYIKKKFSTHFVNVKKKTNANSWKYMKHINKNRKKQNDKQFDDSTRE